MQTSLISVKAKDTENLNWEKSIIGYLKNVYGDQWKNFYSQKTGDFDKLRNSANSELAVDALLDQIHQYYAQLEVLSLRLTDSRLLKMDFIWYNAYDSGRCKQHSLAFEKSNTLFNMAAACTQLAAGHYETGSYKDTILMYQNAAGIYDYMSKNFLNSPSLDLQSDTTTFLAHLAHAQAQELFLLKLINDDSSKYSLIAKLAMGCVNLYKCCEIPDHVVPYGEDSWKDLISAKVNYYQAVTGYNYACSIEDKKIGEALGMLSHVKEVVELSDDMDFSVLQEKLDAKLSQLTKDNDYVFHQSITSVDFSVVKGMEAVKPIEFTKQMANFVPEDDIFEGIVPMAVYEKESVYSEEKATILRAESENVQTADLEYESFLEYVKMPSILDDLQRSLEGKLDPRLEAWSKHVASSPYANVEFYLKQLVDKKQSVLESIKKCPPDVSLTIKKSLVDASASDEQLFSLVRPFSTELAAISTPGGLSRVFNVQSESLLDLDDTANDNSLKILADTRKLFESLRLLKGERDRILGELKEEMNNDDISNILVYNKNLPENEMKKLFADELEKFRPLSNRIESSIFKQQKIINDMKKNLDVIIKNSSATNNDLILRYELVYNNFSKFEEDFPAGLEFYDSLLRMAKDAQVDDLTEQLNRVSIDSQPGYSTNPHMPPSPGYFSLPQASYNAPQTPVDYQPPATPGAPTRFFQASTPPGPPKPPGPPSQSHLQNAPRVPGYQQPQHYQHPQVPLASQHPQAAHSSFAYQQSIPQYQPPRPPAPPGQPQSPSYNRSPFPIPSGLSSPGQGAPRVPQLPPKDQSYNSNNNPNSIYDNPSVFDNSLYSRYAGN